MRITIVTADGFVAIDGNGVDGIDLSFIPNEVHALQWYGDVGEIEYKDTLGRATHSENITSINQFIYFPQCYELWKQAKANKNTKQFAELK
jgi:hypothetical protein